MLVIFMGLYTFFFLYTFSDIHCPTFKLSLIDYKSALHMKDIVKLIFGLF